MCSGMARAVDFVNVTAPQDLKDAGYRRRVHAQAMRAYRRHERLQRMQEFHHLRPGDTQPSAIAKPDATPRLDRARGEPYHSILRMHHQLSRMSISGPISDTHLDPFNSLPLALSRHQQSLISHFADDIGTTMVPISTLLPWTHIWLKEAIANRLLFLATCSHASDHLDKIRNQPPTELSLQLRGATLRVLKEALNDDKASTDDMTIATLEMLGGNALISGDFAELTMHMNTLERIITWRGGLCKHGFQGTLRIAAMWQFAASAILQRLDILDVASPREPKDGGIINETTIHFETLEALLNRSRNLSCYLSSGEAYGATQVQDYIEERTDVEFSFIRLWKLLERGHGCCLPEIDIVRCACLSGLLFSFCYLRKLTASSPLARQITAAILKVANSICVNDILNASSLCNQEIMLWTLTTACVLSAVSGQRIELARLAGTLRDHLHLKDAHQLRERLQSIAWPPSEWDETLQREMFEVRAIQ